jgi:hypothetical protein
MAVEGFSRAAVAIASLLTLAGCGAKPEAATGFNTDMPMVELMGHVFQPAAENFWAGAGSISDADGTRDLRPTDAAGWKSVEDGAATLAEAGNLLLLPGRLREPAADWTRHAHDLTKVAMEAKAAAEGEADEAALLDVGERLYNVCMECHEQFAPPPAETPVKAAP